MAHPLIALAALALFLGVVAGVNWVSWRYSRFRVGGGQVELRQGFLFRQHRQVRLERVQAVELSRPLLARLLGLARVVVQSAGGSDSTLTLSFLDLAPCRGAARAPARPRRAHRRGHPGQHGPRGRPRDRHRGRVGCRTAPRRPPRRAAAAGARGAQRAAVRRDDPARVDHRPGRAPRVRAPRGRGPQRRTAGPGRHPRPVARRDRHRLQPGQGAARPRQLPPRRRRHRRAGPGGAHRPAGHHDPAAPHPGPRARPAVVVAAGRVVADPRERRRVGRSGRARGCPRDDPAAGGHARRRAAGARAGDSLGPVAGVGRRRARRRYGHRVAGPDPGRPVARPPVVAAQRLGRRPVGGADALRPADPSGHRRAARAHPVPHRAAGLARVAARPGHRARGATARTGHPGAGPPRRRDAETFLAEVSARARSARRRSEPPRAPLAPDPPGLVDWSRHPQGTPEPERP